MSRRHGRKSGCHLAMLTPSNCEGRCGSQTRAPGLAAKLRRCPQSLRLVSFCFFLMWIISVVSVEATPGASVPWTTYEAEDILVSGGDGFRAAI